MTKKMKIFVLFFSFVLLFFFFFFGYRTRNSSKTSKSQQDPDVEVFGFVVRPRLVSLLLASLHLFASLDDAVRYLREEVSACVPVHKLRSKVLWNWPVLSASSMFFKAYLVPTPSRCARRRCLSSLRISISAKEDYVIHSQVPGKKVYGYLGCGLMPFPPSPRHPR